MAGVVQNSEVAVVLGCEGNVFVAVPQSVLMKESTVFRAKLSATWQNGNPESGICNLYSKKYMGLDKTSYKEYPFIILAQNSIF